MLNDFIHFIKKSRTKNMLLAWLGAVLIVRLILYVFPGIAGQSVLSNTSLLVSVGAASMIMELLWSVLVSLSVIVLLAVVLSFVVKGNAQERNFRLMFKFVLAVSMVDAVLGLLVGVLALLLPLSIVLALGMFYALAMFAITIYVLSELTNITLLRALAASLVAGLVVVLGLMFLIAPIVLAVTAAGILI